MLVMSSSVGVKLDSNFASSGLLVSDGGVGTAGLGLVGSRPDGYERGSGRRILERDELVDAMDGAMDGATDGSTEGECMSPHKVR